MANVQTATSALEVLWRQAPGGELVDLGRPHRSPLALSRLHTTPKGVLSRREVDRCLTQQLHLASIL